MPVMQIFYGDRIDGHSAFIAGCLGFSPCFAFSINSKWYAKVKNSWVTYNFLEDMMIKNNINSGRVISLPEQFASRVGPKITSSIIVSEPTLKMTAYFDDVIGFTRIKGTVYDIIKTILDETIVGQYISTESGYEEMVTCGSEITILDELCCEENSQFTRTAIDMYYLGMGVKITPPDDWENVYQILNFIMACAEESHLKFQQVTGVSLDKIERVTSSWIPYDKPEQVQSYRSTLSVFIANLLGREYVRFNDQFANLMMYFNAIQNSTSEDEIEKIVESLFLRAAQIINGDYSKKKIKVPPPIKISAEARLLLSSNPVEDSSEDPITHDDRVAMIIEEFVNPDELGRYQEFRKALKDEGVVIRPPTSVPIVTEIDCGGIIKKFNLSLGEDQPLDHIDTNDLHVILSIVSERTASGQFGASVGAVSMNHIAQELRRRQFAS